jgi:hypothetical protein
MGGIKEIQSGSKKFSSSRTTTTLRLLPIKRRCCLGVISSGNENDSGNPCKLAISYTSKDVMSK